MTIDTDMSVDTGPASLRDDVGGRIRELVPALTSEVYVGWVAAIDAATCPARYRASGADGWGFPGWSPALAGAAVARAALTHHLHHYGGSPPEPLEAVRRWVREAPRGPGSAITDWIADLVRASDRVTLAATAAAATRWMGGFVRVMGWPLPDRLALVTDAAGDGPFDLRWAKRWRPARGSKVCVASSPDAVVGKVTPSGHFDLLIHRPSSPGEEALADRAAFEAAAAALSSGITGEHVVIATGDSGERVRFPIGPALLARGADLIVEVVRQRVQAQTDWDFADATPSSACHHCPEKAGCEPGSLWLSGPGRWRGGLPVL